MNQAIVAKLIQLNAEFYQTFSTQFSDTRMRIQPGVRRILESIDPESKILDLGCGNGELARVLHDQEFRGTYLGVDFSKELLDVARKGVAGNDNFRFVQGSIADPGWQAALGTQLQAYDVVLSFAALHHLPGKETHRQILHAVRNLLTSEGRFIHSNWQFLNSERLRKRIHPWSEIGLSDADVDPGDYLLDWRRGGFGLRYVHHFNEDELNALAAETGFSVSETFYSDGETGDLGLYQIWTLAKINHKENKS
jgi:SAM-dependent methyltransferase